MHFSQCKILRINEIVFVGTFRRIASLSTGIVSEPSTAIGHLLVFRSICRGKNLRPSNLITGRGSYNVPGERSYGSFGPQLTYFLVRGTCRSCSCHIPCMVEWPACPCSPSGLLGLPH